MKRLLLLIVALAVASPALSCALLEDCAPKARHRLAQKARREPEKPKDTAQLLIEHEARIVDLERVARDHEVRIQNNSGTMMSGVPTN